MNAYLDEKFKKGFETDQFVSSTDIVRNFSKLRMKAKKAPLLILDKNSPDSVLLSIEDYNHFVQVVNDLSEEIFDLKVMEKIKQLEADGVETVPFSQIANHDVLKAVKEAENWDIKDEELFE